jgi:hypothetical protein
VNEKLLNDLEGTDMCNDYSARYWFWSFSLIYEDLLFAQSLVKGIFALDSVCDLGQTGKGHFMLFMSICFC